MEQAECFRSVSIYLFATVAQSLMYFVIVLDMLIAVTLPMKLVSFIAPDVVTALSALMAVMNTGAIVVVIALVIVVAKNEKSLKDSRHRGSSPTVPCAITCNTIRVMSRMVTLFVCTWYFCVTTVLVAVNLKLPEDYLDHIITINMIPAMMAYSQNFYGLHACSRYAPILRQQGAWFRRCLKVEDKVSTVKSTTTSSESALVSEHTFSTGSKSAIF
ncbi:unnamed protein product [Cylicocyclus nassatus]|uniref:G-protein coupled receptors family 1 profile domain-containing protein n=1 Tax=Cylicocyclus nassatus TaxID=53992 RepID=A0AA36DLP1_CYLNA|nr:unnamed protein product [Cylicocyclus nassatus]